MAPDTSSVGGVVALRARFRRTERITAFVTLSVAGVFLVVGLVVAVFGVLTVDVQFVFLALGTGSVVGNVLFTLRNAGDEIPWARDGDSMPAKPIRKAALSGGTSGLNDGQVGEATRWAAQESLHLRASVVSAILTIAAITGFLIVPQLVTGAVGPLGWGLIALYATLLGLTVPMSIRQRRLDGFASRMGAWDGARSTVSD